MDEKFWKSKTVVITGGTKGLGLVLTRELVAAGANVFVIARNAAVWDSLAEELAPARFIAADVTDMGSARLAIEKVAELAGGIDWLINNVGASTRVEMVSASSELFWDQMRVNFLSTVNCTQSALPYLLPRRGGVINIASLAAKTPWPWMGPYVASKAAVAAYTDQLRFEVTELSTVLLVCPGPIARADAGVRYQREMDALPAVAHRPGAGAKIKGLQPLPLAHAILKAAAAGKRELVLPAKAKWLFRIAVFSPTVGDWLRKRFGAKN